MTPEYRQRLLWLLAEQARAELWGATFYAGWIAGAPGPDERLRMADLAHEEAEHWHRIVLLMQELGVPSERIPELYAKHHFYRLARLLTLRCKWLDVLMISFLIDRTAYILVEDFAQSSYAPWSAVAREILTEEESHPLVGQTFIAHEIERLGRTRVQRSLRKWWPIALNVFGPSHTAGTDLYLRLGLKFRTGEERREAFRQACGPQIAALGLSIPRLLRDRFPFV